MVRVGCCISSALASFGGTSAVVKGEFVVLLQNGQPSGLLSAVPSLTDTLDANESLPLKVDADHHQTEADNVVKTVQNMVQTALQEGALPDKNLLDALQGQFEVFKAELKQDNAVQQKLVEDANGALNLCNAEHREAFQGDSGVDKMGATADQHREHHRNCRIAEASFLSVKMAKCEEFRLLSTAQQCHSSQWLKADGETLVAAGTRCEDEKDKLLDKAGLCDDAQKLFEEVFCAYRAKFKAACSADFNCRRDRGEIRQNTYNATKALEESHKTLWSSYSKGLCFLGLLKKAHESNLTNAGLEHCQDLQPDTSALDVNYPDADPAWSGCLIDKVFIYPGDSLWVGQEYSSEPFKSHSDMLNPTAACPASVPTAPSVPKAPSNAASLDVDGGGWQLAATFSNADGRENDHWIGENGKTFSGHWVSDDVFGDCTGLNKADCRSSAWFDIRAVEILVKEDSAGHVGIRSWTLKQPDTLANIFKTKSQENIASSSKLIQDPGTDAMALAYKNQAGYLLVNTDLDGAIRKWTYCDPENMASCAPEADGCHLVGWWSRQQGSESCSSGLGCVIDQRYDFGERPGADGRWDICNGDVTTSNAGKSYWYSSTSKVLDHTVWLFVRSTIP